MVSANPDDLDGCAAACDEIDMSLADTHDTLYQASYGFKTTNLWGILNADALVENTGSWILANLEDSRFLHTVAQVFRDADARGVAVSDIDVWAALEAAGFGWEGGSRSDLTVAPSTAMGGETTTGYAVDPVSMASGNLYEPEVDLAFGPALGWLQVRRTYNSLDAEVGPFGPGWSSWASTRLVQVRAGRAASLRGPDGQRAEIPLPQGTVAGFGGRVEVPKDGDGAGLLARFPMDGTVWRFDAAGHPVEIDGGSTGRVALDWDGDRLTAMSHDRGRSVRMAWEGDRIVAAVADDGRRADYAYDEAGRLVAADSPAGARRYQWSARDRIAAIVDADGVVAARNRYDVPGWRVGEKYDTAGRVVRQQTPFGRQVRFWYRPGLTTEVDDNHGGPANRWTHDEQGRLTQVVDGEGHAVTKTYDEAGRPRRVTDRRGATTSYVWDDQGRCRRIERPDGVAVTLDWDERNRCVEVVGPQGATVRYTYDGDDRTPSVIEDPEGGLTRAEVRDGLVHRVVDPDGVTVTFEHDAYGQVVAATDGTGSTHRYEWDAAGNLVAVVSPLGHRVEIERDAAGRVLARRDPDGAEWRVERTAAGRITALVDATGARRELRYGPHGNVVEDVDPFGAVTSQQWDQNGALVGTVRPDGGRWTFVHDGLLRVASLTDPSGATWLRDHDPEGTLVGTTTPTGTRREVDVDDAGRVTALHDGLADLRFEYDDAGRAVTQVQPGGATARLAYDRCGRIVARTEPSGAVTRYEHSPGGRLLAVVAPGGGRTTHRYDEAGRLAETVDATGGRRRFRYDADGRLVRTTNPAGEKVRYGYDPAGRMVTATNPAGGVNHYAYDPVGRLVEAVDPTGGVTRYGYDLAGRLVTVVDPNGGEARFERDALGRITARVDPTGARTEVTYDEMGRPVQVSDPLGRVTRHRYDRAGRRVGRVDPDGARWWWRWDGADQLAAWGVDDTEVRLTRDLAGRVVRVDRDGAPSVTRRWDAGGHLVAETVGGIEAFWERDEAGEVVAATLRGPAEATTTWELDAAGRPVVVDDPALGRFTVERDAVGRPVQVVGPDWTERHTWSDGRKVAWSREADGETLASIRYRHDLAGRVVEERHDDGRQVRYCYDPAGQLIAVQPVDPEEVGGSHGLGGAGRDGPGDDGWCFAWDAAGRLVEERGPAGSRSFRYDAAGQLTGITHSGGDTRIDWDACGRRLAETGPHGTRRYEWDVTGALRGVHTTGPDGTTTTRRLDHDAAGRLVAVDGTPVGWDTAAPVERLWSVGEARIVGPGSIPQLVVGGVEQGDGAGGAGAAPADRGDGDAVPAEVDVWGARVESPPGGPSPGTALPGGLRLGHRGELDVDGLIWLRARTYDPHTRSLLTPDPLPGDPGRPWAHNPYHYAANDPVGHADPLGLRPVTDAELRELTDNWSDNAWDRYGGYVVGGLMIVGGIILLASGVGSMAGAALIGAAFGGGFSAVSQQAINGEVDWTRVGVDAALGAGFGGVAAGAGAMTAASGTAMRAGVQIGIESVGGTLSGVVTRYAYGENPWDMNQINMDAVTGVFGEGLGEAGEALATARYGGFGPDFLPGAGGHGAHVTQEQAEAAAQSAEPGRSPYGNPLMVEDNVPDVITGSGAAADIGTHPVPTAPAAPGTPATPAAPHTPAAPPDAPTAPTGDPAHAAPAGDPVHAAPAGDPAAPAPATASGIGAGHPTTSPADGTGAPAHGDGAGTGHPTTGPTSDAPAGPAHAGVNGAGGASTSPGNSSPAHPAAAAGTSTAGGHAAGTDALHGVPTRNEGVDPAVRDGEASTADPHQVADPAAAAAGHTATSGHPDATATPAAAAHHTADPAAGARSPDVAATAGTDGHPQGATAPEHVIPPDHVTAGSAARPVGEVEALGLTHTAGAHPADVPASPAPRPGSKADRIVHSIEFVPDPGAATPGDTFHPGRRVQELLDLHSHDPHGRHDPPGDGDRAPDGDDPAVVDRPPEPVTAAAAVHAAAMSGPALPGRLGGGRSEPARMRADDPARGAGSNRGGGTGDDGPTSTPPNDRASEPVGEPPAGSGGRGGGRGPTDPPPRDPPASTDGPSSPDDGDNPSGERPRDDVQSGGSTHDPGTSGDSHGPGDSGYAPRFVVDEPHIRPVVDRAVRMAWDRTEQQSWFQRQEHGGEVIYNDATGHVRTVDYPPGDRSSITLGTPRLQPGERVIATYHTHPGPGEGFDFTVEYEPGKVGALPNPDDSWQGWRLRGPTQRDFDLARREGTISIVRAEDGTYIYDPGLDELRFESVNPGESWSRRVGSPDIASALGDPVASLPPTYEPDAPWRLAERDPDAYADEWGDADVQSHVGGGPRGSRGSTIDEVSPSPEGHRGDEGHTRSNHAADLPEPGRGREGAGDDIPPDPDGGDPRPGDERTATPPNDRASEPAGEPPAGDGGRGGGPDRGGARGGDHTSTTTEDPHQVELDRRVRAMGTGAEPVVPLSVTSHRAEIFSPRPLERPFDEPAVDRVVRGAIESARQKAIAEQRSVGGLIIVREPVDGTSEVLVVEAPESSTEPTMMPNQLLEPGEHAAVAGFRFDMATPDDPTGAMGLPRLPSGPELLHASATNRTLYLCGERTRIEFTPSADPSIGHQITLWFKDMSRPPAFAPHFARSEDIDLGDVTFDGDFDLRDHPSFRGWPAGDSPHVDAATNEPGGPTSDIDARLNSLLERAGSQPRSALPHTVRSYPTAPRPSYKRVQAIEENLNRVFDEIWPGVPGPPAARCGLVTINDVTGEMRVFEMLPVEPGRVVLPETPPGGLQDNERVLLEFRPDPSLRAAVEGPSAADLLLLSDGRGLVLQTPLARYTLDPEGFVDLRDPRRGTLEMQSHTPPMQPWKVHVSDADLGPDFDLHDVLARELPGHDHFGRADYAAQRYRDAHGDGGDDGPTGSSPSGRPDPTDPTDTTPPAGNQPSPDPSPEGVPRSDSSGDRSEVERSGNGEPVGRSEHDERPAVDPPAERSDDRAVTVPAMTASGHALPGRPGGGGYGPARMRADDPERGDGSHRGNGGDGDQPRTPPDDRAGEPAGEPPAGSGGRGGGTGPTDPPPHDPPGSTDGPSSPDDGDNPNHGDAHSGDDPGGDDAHHGGDDPTSPEQVRQAIEDAAHLPHRRGRPVPERLRDAAQRIDGLADGHRPGCDGAALGNLPHFRPGARPTGAAPSTEEGTAHVRAETEEGSAPVRAEVVEAGARERARDGVVDVLATQPTPTGTPTHAVVQDALEEARAVVARTGEPARGRIVLGPDGEIHASPIPHDRGQQPDPSTAEVEAPHDGSQTVIAEYVVDPDPGRTVPTNDELARAHEEGIVVIVETPHGTWIHPPPHSPNPQHAFSDLTTPGRLGGAIDGHTYFVPNHSLRGFGRWDVNLSQVEFDDAFHLLNHLPPELRDAMARPPGESTPEPGSGATAPPGGDRSGADGSEAVGEDPRSDMTFQRDETHYLPLDGRPLDSSHPLVRYIVDKAIGPPSSADAAPPTTRGGQVFVDADRATVRVVEYSSSGPDQTQLPSPDVTRRPGEQVLVEYRVSTDPTSGVDGPTGRDLVDAQDSGCRFVLDTPLGRYDYDPADQSLGFESKHPNIEDWVVRVEPGDATPDFTTRDLLERELPGNDHVDQAQVVARQLGGEDGAAGAGPSGDPTPTDPTDTTPPAPPGDRPDAPSLSAADREGAQQTVADAFTSSPPASGDGPHPLVTAVEQATDVAASRGVRSVSGVVVVGPDGGLYPELRPYSRDELADQPAASGADAADGVVATYVVDHDPTRVVPTREELQQARSQDRVLVVKTRIGTWVYQPRGTLDFVPGPSQPEGLRWSTSVDDPARFDVHASAPPALRDTIAVVEADPVLSPDRMTRGLQVDSAVETLSMSDRQEPNAGPERLAGPAFRPPGPPAEGVPPTGDVSAGARDPLVEARMRQRGRDAVVRSMVTPSAPTQRLRTRLNEALDAAREEAARTGEPATGVVVLGPDNEIRTYPDGYGPSTGDHPGGAQRIIGEYVVDPDPTRTVPTGDELQRAHTGNVVVIVDTPSGTWIHPPPRHTSPHVTFAGPMAVTPDVVDVGRTHFVPNRTMDGIKPTGVNLDKVQLGSDFDLSPHLPRELQEALNDAARTRRDGLGDLDTPTSGGPDHPDAPDGPDRPADSDTDSTTTRNEGDDDGEGDAPAARSTPDPDPDTTTPTSGARPRDEPSADTDPPSGDGGRGGGIGPTDPTDPPTQDPPDATDGPSFDDGDNPDDQSHAVGEREEAQHSGDADLQALLRSEMTYVGEVFHRVPVVDGRPVEPWHDEVQSIVNQATAPPDGPAAAVRPSLRGGHVYADATGTVRVVEYRSSGPDQTRLPHPSVRMEPGERFLVEYRVSTDPRSAVDGLSGRDLFDAGDAGCQFTLGTPLGRLTYRPDDRILGFHQAHPELDDWAARVNPDDVTPGFSIRDLLARELPGHDHADRVEDIVRRLRGEEGDDGPTGAGTPDPDPTDPTDTTPPAGNQRSPDPSPEAAPASDSSADPSDGERSGDDESAGRSEHDEHPDDDPPAERSDERPDDDAGRLPDGAIPVPRAAPDDIRPTTDDAGAAAGAAAGGGRQVGGEPAPVDDVAIVAAAPETVDVGAAVPAIATSGGARPGHPGGGSDEPARMRADDPPGGGRSRGDRPGRSGRDRAGEPPEDRPARRGRGGGGPSDPPARRGGGTGPTKPPPTDPPRRSGPADDDPEGWNEDQGRDFFLGDRDDDGTNPWSRDQWSDSEDEVSESVIGGDPPPRDHTPEPDEEEDLFTGFGPYRPPAARTPDPDPSTTSPHRDERRSRIHEDRSPDPSDRTTPPATPDAEPPARDTSDSPADEPPVTVHVPFDPPSTGAPGTSTSADWGVAEPPDVDIQRLLDPEGLGAEPGDPPNHRGEVDPEGPGATDPAADAPAGRAESVGDGPLGIGEDEARTIAARLSGDDSQDGDVPARDDLDGDAHGAADDPNAGPATGGSSAEPGQDRSDRRMDAALHRDRFRWSPERSGDLPGQPSWLTAGRPAAPGTPSHPGADDTAPPAGDGADVVERVPAGDRDASASQADDGEETQGGLQGDLERYQEAYHPVPADGRPLEPGNPAVDQVVDDAIAAAGRWAANSPSPMAGGQVFAHDGPHEVRVVEYGGSGPGQTELPVLSTLWGGRLVVEYRVSLDPFAAVEGPDGMHLYDGHENGCQSVLHVPGIGRYVYDPRGTIEFRSQHPDLDDVPPVPVRRADLNPEFSLRDVLARELPGNDHVDQVEIVARRLTGEVDDGPTATRPPDPTDPTDTTPPTGGGPLDDAGLGRGNEAPIVRVVGDDPPLRDWPREAQDEYQEYRRQHADRLVEEFDGDVDDGSTGTYDGYVRGAADLFGGDGEFSRFWDAERGRFDEEAWANAPLAERHAVATGLETIRADVEAGGPGRGRPRRVELVAWPPGRNVAVREGGAYRMRPGRQRSRLDGDTIQVGQDLTLAETVESVAHEGFHVHQRRVVASPSRADHPYGETWARDLDAYVSASRRPVRYRSQAIEIDARIFGERFADDLTARIRQGNAGGAADAGGAAATADGPVGRDHDGAPSPEPSAEPGRGDDPGAVDPSRVEERIRGWLPQSARPLSPAVQAELRRPMSPEPIRDPSGAVIPEAELLGSPKGAAPPDPDRGTTAPEPGAGGSGSPRPGGATDEPRLPPPSARTDVDWVNWRYDLDRRVEAAGPDEGDRIFEEGRAEVARFFAEHGGYPGHLPPVVVERYLAPVLGYDVSPPPGGHPHDLPPGSPAAGRSEDTGASPPGSEGLGGDPPGHTPLDDADFGRDPDRDEVVDGDRPAAARGPDGDDEGPAPDGVSGRDDVLAMFGPDPATYQRYIDGFAEPFGRWGELSHFWDPQRGDFNEDAWRAAPPRVRKAILQGIEDLRAETMPPLRPLPPGSPIRGYTVHLSDDGSAFTTWETPGVSGVQHYVNVQEGRSLKGSFDTVLHEGCHARQTELVEAAQESDTPAFSHPHVGVWAYESDHYIDLQADAVGYREQLIERDAGVYEDTVMHDVSRAIEGLWQHPIRDPRLRGPVTRAIEAAHARTQEGGWREGGTVVVDVDTGTVRIVEAAPVSPDAVMMPDPPLAGGERIVGRYVTRPPFGADADGPTGMELRDAWEQQEDLIVRTEHGVFVFDHGAVTVRFEGDGGSWNAHLTEAELDGFDLRDHARPDGSPLPPPGRDPGALDQAQLDDQIHGWLGPGGNPPDGSGPGGGSTTVHRGTSEGGHEESPSPTPHDPARSPGGDAAGSGDGGEQAAPPAGGRGGTTDAAPPEPSPPVGYGHPQVQEVLHGELADAWAHTRQDSGSWFDRREHGGAIVVDDATGSVHPVRFLPGERTTLDMPNPEVLDSAMSTRLTSPRVAVMYHTHPGPAGGYEFVSTREGVSRVLEEPDGVSARLYPPGPSALDVVVAYAAEARGHGYVQVVRAVDGIYAYDPKTGVLTVERVVHNWRTGVVETYDLSSVDVDSLVGARSVLPTNDHVPDEVLTPASLRQWSAEPLKDALAAMPEGRLPLAMQGSDVRTLARQVRDVVLGADPGHGPDRQSVMDALREEMGVRLGFDVPPSLFSAETAPQWLPDVLDQVRSTDSVPYIPGGGLAAHEGRVVDGPYRTRTLDDHVELTDAELRQRLRDDPGLSAASTFDSEAQADDHVTRALHDRHETVRQWLGTEPGPTVADRLELTVPSATDVGRVLPRGAATPVAGRGVRVVLEVAPPGSSLEFHIVEAHPTTHMFEPDPRAPAREAPASVPDAPPPAPARSTATPQAGEASVPDASPMGSTGPRSRAASADDGPQDPAGARDEPGRGKDPGRPGDRSAEDPAELDASRAPGRTLPGEEPGPQRYEVDDSRDLPYGQWPREVRDQIEAYREQYATRLAYQLGPGRYDKYVDQVGKLFKRGGELDQFCDHNTGRFDEEAWRRAPLDVREAVTNRLEEIRARATAAKKSSLSKRRYPVHLVAPKPLGPDGRRVVAETFHSPRLSECRIELDRNLSLADTVLHSAIEGFHVRQYAEVRILRPSPEQAHPHRAIWKEYLERQARSGQGPEVEDGPQLWGLDARIFADKFVDDLTASIQPRTYEVQDPENLPYDTWPQELRDQLGAHREQHAADLADQLGPGRYGMYVDEVAGLFRRGGEFARFWDHEIGGFDESAWSGAPLHVFEKLASRLEEMRAQTTSPLPDPNQPRARQLHSRLPWRVRLVAPKPAGPDGPVHAETFDSPRLSECRIELDWTSSLADAVRHLASQGFLVRQYGLVRSGGQPHGGQQDPRSWELDAQVFTEKFVRDLLAAIGA
jgi:RHS repeat-associated protein